MRASATKAIRPTAPGFWALSFVAGLLAIGAMLAIGAGAAHASDHCDIDVPGDHATIQDAIDAADAGDTICVEAGTYPEALTVNKDLTLLGAQEGVDARERAASESVITSPGEDAILITEDADLVVDGFHFDDVLRFVLTEDVGLGSPGVPSGWGDLELRNNIFENAAPAAGGNFWLRDDPGDTFVFEQNRVTGNAPSNGLRIRAIERSDPPGELVDVDISENLWQDNGAWAMNVNNIEGAIAGNVVRNTDGGPDERGFLLATADTDLLLEGNEFDGLTSVAVNLAFGFSGTLVGTENTFTDNVFGFAASAGQDVEDVALNFNDFEGNTTAVSNNAANEERLDATCNWWGAADGPSGAGSGSGDSVSANVDFDPWLTAPFAVSGPCPPPPPPTTADECKKGGWEDHGFKNQGQCIRFVNTGKDSR